MIDPVKNGNNFAPERLKSFVERVERLNEEIKGLQDDRKEVLAEAKATGFDVKTIRKVIQRRKMDANERAEADALLDMYERIFG